jgi:hypothetical protein
MWVWQILRHHKMVCGLDCFLVFGGVYLCVDVGQRCFLSHPAWKHVCVDVAACGARKKSFKVERLYEENFKAEANQLYAW